MRLFTRKSKWDRFMDVAAGAVAATAASAAVSTARRQDEK